MLGADVKTYVLKQMIDVIRVEEQRRAEPRADMHPEVTYDQRVFTDAPFVNELCLMLLVALRHQVEREWFCLRRASAATEPKSASSNITRMCRRKESY